MRSDHESRTWSRLRCPPFRKFVDRDVTTANRPVVHFPNLQLYVFRRDPNSKWHIVSLFGSDKVDLLMALSDAVPVSSPMGCIFDARAERNLAYIASDSRLFPAYSQSCHAVPAHQRR